MNSSTQHSTKPRILLHVCCGPDVSIPLVDLKNQYDILCFWYDPNIQPKEEYDKRLEAFIEVCRIENIPYIIGEYDVNTFFNAIKGLEHTPERGEKCEKCYDLRLRASAMKAKELGIGLYTTSLNISPKKCIEKLFEIGDFYAKKFGLEEFLKIEFRKNNGFGRSVEYTKQHGIYRQNYCGCIYSIRDGAIEAKRKYFGENYEAVIAKQLATKNTTFEKTFE